MPEEQLVFLVKTTTTTFLEIREPGSQAVIRVVHCSLKEGKTLWDQLTQVLYDAGVFKSGDT